jgi:uncharacterized protein (DUF302 family)
MPGDATFQIGVPASARWPRGAAVQLPIYLTLESDSGFDPGYVQSAKKEGAMRNLSASLMLVLAILPFTSKAAKEAPAPLKIDIAQTVVKMPLADGVSVDDAMQFLQSKAVELNMKIVAHQDVSKELRARGIDSGPLHIFQFCNPEDAHKMVMYNAIFAAYMPCRIALVQDSDGKIWLMMLNLDILINNTPLPPPLHAMAERINKDLMEIMKAGATASF